MDRARKAPARPAIERKRQRELQRILLRSQSAQSHSAATRLRQFVPHADDRRAHDTEPLVKIFHLSSEVISLQYNLVGAETRLDLLKLKERNAQLNCGILRVHLK